MQDNNRIVANTIVVYAQLVISTIVGLLAVRFILKSLGEEDYGIYMLVGGVIAMLNVLTSSLQSTSMRYLSHGLANNNNIEAATKIFNSSLILHISLALFLVVVLEIGGLIMFEYFLNIPETRVFSAKIIYQFMVFTTFIDVISVPYDAIMNAHENLLFLSSVTIAGHILILTLSIVLMYLDGDLLIIYGLVIMLIHLGQRIVKQVYTKCKYKECVINFHKFVDKTTIRSMLSFTGWEFFSSFSAMCSEQLRSIFVNMFFGVRLNASEGIAKQVNGHVNQLSTGITSAITPQMNKSAGSGDRDRLIQLTFSGVKYTTFMFSLIAVPICLESNFILKIWLGDVPEYAPLFVIFCITICFISKLTWQIGNAIRAIGDIKWYRIVSGSVSICSMFFVYLVLKLGYGPSSIYVTQIVFCIIGGVITICFGKKIVKIRPMEYVSETILPIFGSLFLALVISLPLRFLMEEGWLRLVFVLMGFISVFSLSFYLIAMRSREREFFLSLVKTTCETVITKLK